MKLMPKSNLLFAFGMAARCITDHHACSHGLNDILLAIWGTNHIAALLLVVDHVLLPKLCWNGMLMDISQGLVQHH